MEARRRAYLTDPGEPLLLQEVALDVATRAQKFLDDTGLDESSIISTPLVSAPLPVRRHGAGARGWPSTLNPAMLWHPLFWVPARIAHRYRMNVNGAEVIETADEWAVRVGIESTIATLYDPNTGTWIDALSLFDLDVDDPSVQARIAAWLSGADDSDLDAVDLSAMTELADDPHWAVAEAADMLPTLQQSSWALMASDLQFELTQPTEDRRIQVALVANLMVGLLGDVPARDADSTMPPAKLAEFALTALERGQNPELIADHLAAALSEAVEDYLPFLHLLQAELDEPEAAAA